MIQKQTYLALMPQRQVKTATESPKQTSFWLRWPLATEQSCGLRLNTLNTFAAPFSSRRCFSCCLPTLLCAPAPGCDTGLFPRLGVPFQTIMTQLGPWRLHWVWQRLWGVYGPGPGCVFSLLFALIQPHSEDNICRYYYCNLMHHHYHHNSHHH